jgi:hypothetical protein
MSGLSWVAGIGRALNIGFPFPLSLPWLEPPLTVDGLVTTEGAYPSSSVALRNAAKIEEETDLMDP